MEMDIGGQTDLQEERMSDRRSLSSNYRYCSQSRKISIGVPVGSISMAKTKGLQEPGATTAERRYSQKDSVNDREGHPSPVEKHMIVEQNDASPWVSTRSFNQKMSSSVADKDSKHFPSFPATRQTRPRSELLEKASAAPSLKFFAAKSGLDDVNRQKNYGKDISSMEAWKVSNVEHEENPACSAEQGVLQEKEEVQNKERATETGGRESLRIKLWEILGDESLPNKHLPRLQCGELHQDEERNKKQGLIQKINPNSDTIESDSQTHIFTRPMTRSLTRRKVSTRKQSSEAAKSIHKIDCQRSKVFSLKDLPAGLYDNVINGSLPCKREKIMGVSSGAAKNQGAKQRNVEDRQQSERSIAIPPVEKALVHMNKVSNASSSTDRRNDGLVVPKKGTENHSSFEFSLNTRADQRNVEQPVDVEASKKNLQEDTSNSLLKRKRNSLQPKKGTEHNSFIEFAHMTDQINEKQSTDVPGSKKNMKEDMPGSLLIKKRNSVQPKKDTRHNSLFEFPFNATIDQRDGEPSMHVDVSKKNLQEDISDSLLQKNSVHDPSTPPSRIQTHSSLQKSKHGELQGPSPAEKICNRTSIRNLKSLLSPKSAECRPDVQQEPSVSLTTFSISGTHDSSNYYIADTSSLINFKIGRYKLNNSPKKSPLVKPNIVMEGDSDNQMSNSSTDETDSHGSEDKSHKDCVESDELSPKNRITEDIQHNSRKSLGSDKDVGVIGSSPSSCSFKGAQNPSELGIYMEENQEDGLARSVTLITLALTHIKTKLKSISSRRSGDILRAAVEEILLRLQNAESHTKKDVGKLTNLSQSKSKRLETRFQEKQEELIGIHKRFKAEVEQHLQECGSLIEDLEEHEIELKRSVEKQKTAHKKFLLQVEQEINVQLEDAESRIMGVQEMAREKMLQLKLGVTECLRQVLQA